MSSTALVYGIAISGEAVARALHDRGVRVLVADDAPNDSKSAVAAAFGAELIAKPDAATIDRLVSSADIVCPAPGVPETHAVIDAANRHRKPIRTEIDLAYEWEQQRVGGPRPMLAVTGTDGKTTTTMMAAAMLRCAGLKVAAVGNTEVPLIAALDTDVDAFVVECSSFRLNWIDHFRSEASVWLNLADDHQNWHVSMPAYERAKARMWRHNRPSDVAVGNAADPVVMRNLATAAGRRCTFGAVDADYRLVGTTLTGPSGALADRSTMTSRPASRRQQRTGCRGDLDRVRPRWRDRRRRGVGNVRVPAAPHRARRRVRRSHVVQRFEGHDSACRDHGDPRIQQRGAAGGRPQQGARSGQPGTGARAGEGRCRPRRGISDHS